MKVVLNTDIRTAFGFLDNPMKLSSHMGKSSMMMAGSKMSLEIDGKNGQEVGSIIKMKGEMTGIQLFLQEKVIERVPPFKKYWQTFGQQKLLIIDQYKMGFQLNEDQGKTHLTISIDYNIPKSGFEMLLGKMFSRMYAKWCVRQMIHDVSRTFGEIA